MNPIDRNKLIKPILLLVLVFVFVGVATHIHKKNSVTLEQYAGQYPAQQGQSDGDSTGSADTSSPANGNTGSATTGSSADDNAFAGANGSADNSTFAGANGSGNDNNGSPDTSRPVDSTTDSASTPASLLTGALLNGGTDGQAMLEMRVTYRAESADNAADSTPDNAADDAGASFYYEPLSENLRRYITGISYPAQDPGDGSSSGKAPAVSYEDLRYLHLLHYDFDGEVAEGELICNAAIADDLLDIFYKLYRSGYQLEKVLLIDEYDGDDLASMTDNNTSCFNYRMVEGTSSLSKHALGLALDINPFYNPYITYEKNGSARISPAEASEYADRSRDFPYKIDEEDLCYKLFIRHGFTWGGNWNSSKDYQHFQKTPN